MRILSLIVALNALIIAAGCEWPPSAVDLTTDIQPDGVHDAVQGPADVFVEITAETVNFKLYPGEKDQPEAPMATFHLGVVCDRALIAGDVVLDTGVERCAHTVRARYFFRPATADAGCGLDPGRSTSLSRETAAFASETPNVTTELAAIDGECLVSLTASLGSETIQSGTTPLIAVKTSPEDQSAGN